jgi:hypothetical protein
MINRIKKWLTPKNPDYRLIKCFEKSGVELFKFDDVLSLPTCRRLALQSAVHDASLGITSKDLAAVLTSIKTANDKGDRHSISSFIEVLEFYLSQHSASNIMYSIAAPLILLSDEDPEEMNIKALTEKKALFTSNIEVRSFFFHMAWIYLMSFSKQSIGHLKEEDYLNQAEMWQAEQMLQSLITKNTDLTTAIGSIQKFTN